METNLGVLTGAEKINLLILAMKADGLNPLLIADETLGEQAIIAARKFIEHVGKQHEQTTPDNKFTNVFLANFITNKDLGRQRAHSNQFADKAIRIFFAEHGIIL